MIKSSIISDATSLIILGKLDRYDILENIFNHIIIPQGVMDEISVKDDGIYEKIVEQPLFEIKTLINLSLFTLLEGILDQGECEAIILAKDLDLFLLIDEKKGRMVAKNMGLNIIGLIGILILSIKKGKMSKEDAVKSFKSIKKMGFRISKPLEISFLTEINKV